MLRRLLKLLYRALEPRQYSRSSHFNAAHLEGIDGVVLDVGCGGFLSKYAFPAGVRYYGLDITSRATHVRGDAHRLPFRDASVDWVLLVATLEHVVDPARVLSEAHRVLRPNGRVYIAVPFLQMEHGDTDFWRWTEDGLGRLVELSGLKVLRHGVNGGFYVALDYLLWHRFREACRKRDPGMALGALALKVVVQPIAHLVRDVDSSTYATSFHVLACRPGEPT